MSAASSSPRFIFFCSFFQPWYPSLPGLLLLVWMASSCGFTPNPSAQKLSGNTNVTVLLSSTGNDQVTTFDMRLKSLTLTSKAGKAVTLLSAEQPSEFMHLNGSIEPLTNISIPQDIYTSATVTLDGAVFICMSQEPGGGLAIANYSIVDGGPTVNMGALTITGDQMVLDLDMAVSESATFPACYSNPSFQGFAMNPTFNLSVATLSGTPTNSGNGKINGLGAEVASVNGSGLTLSIGEGSYGARTLSAKANSATVFQGISGVSALSAGMFLDVDGAVQPDGSVLATLIALNDAMAVNDSRGPVMMVDTLVPVLALYSRSELGALLSVGGQTGVYFPTPYFDFSKATFGISGRFTNLQSLPFVPSFNALTMVAGQNVDITSPDFILSGGTHTPATTITLIPQTINATVENVSQEGNFTVYGVSLASYDLFPQLAVQAGQTTLLNDPSHVQVYVDSNTQKLNTQSLAAGITLRFNGLVFNDNGTLRMDCAQVNDGVPQ
jgi:hypothetical protein